MGCTILLYGATGYSGRLIADELVLGAKEAPGSYDVVLAGRNAQRLKALGEALGMDYRVFELHDVKQVARALADAGVNVVINAAGPFAATAPTLVSAAIDQSCHYVDINGEADVYVKLGDRNMEAAAAQVAVVSGAGFWAAASNVLLYFALQELAKAQATASGDLGAVRIAMSRIKTPSRGSVETVWRSMREQVTVVRKGRTSAQSRDSLVLWHEPVGKLERSFNFGGPSDLKPDVRIASAASLVDTLAARWTVLRHPRLADTIESYVEAGIAARAGYQLGALLAPLAAIPSVRMLARQPIDLLPEGPTASERACEPHTLLLEIEDAFRTVVIDWRWDTPNVYQFSAQLAVAVARRLGAGSGLKGYRTPSDVLGPLNLPLTDAQTGPMRGCHLFRRRG